MNNSAFPGTDWPGGSLEVLWRDAERIFCRLAHAGANGGRHAYVPVSSGAERPTLERVNRLAHEYGLKDFLDPAWALRPIELVRERGQTMLAVEYQGGEPLARLIGPPMEIRPFLRLAVALSAALDRLHGRGLIHKDIKPGNVVVNTETDQIWLTGFGFASRLPRERQSPQSPESIVGTLAYMAPEQTGRMNRSIDARSDLYALGVTFYEMLTGSLPFIAVDPMEWVHCHIARQAIPPAERVKHVPLCVSTIIMKLLAKNAEERYQTAVGLERDLQRCLSQFEVEGRIDDFALGERDSSDRLLIPEKLYGRQCEVAALLASFERVVQGGAPELVLVSGYSGIGKSAVVNEVHKVLVPPRGLFAAGKFDQYKRDIPYSTLAQAFQSLVRPLLAKSDDELDNWRESLREALGPNGQLMVDLVPELKLIIGEQSSVPELPPQDAQRRFQLVFRRFLSVFAKPEHPLALFLDDLQWLDAATLDLLKDLLTQTDVRHLLLIGAYRDNEVTSTHPLMRTLDAIRSVGARVHEVVLAALAREDAGQLIADSLHCDRRRADPLTQLVHEKTGGNPFFLIQFLNVLADEGLLALDHKQARWAWDLGGIHAKRYTDNVVELLAGKLTRLPPETQDALRQFACLGNVAEVATLSIILGIPEEQAHAALWEGVRQQLIERFERSYQFVHDRVQEAAYALIPEALRAEVHLKIGRQLAAHMPLARREEEIFEIVNQFNRGAGLVTSPVEREQLAELNLAAGRRAMASSAYASALKYLNAGAAILPENAWQCQHKLAFALDLHAADCEMCTGALAAAEGRLEALATRAVDTIERCAVGRRRVDLYAMLGSSDFAAVGLDCLRFLGIDWPEHPTKAQALAEYERIWSTLGSRQIEDIADLPLMEDTESLATLDLLAVMMLPAQYTDENLHTLTVCKAVNICLERGNSAAAPVNYTAMGLIAGGRFGHHDLGYRIGKMACDLIEKRKLKHFGGGRTYFNFAVLIPWTRPLREAIDPARRAVQMGKDEGHPNFAARACRTVTSLLLASGHPLDQLEQEAEQALEFVRPFGFFLDRISAPLALVRTLRGRTSKFGSLDNGAFTEHAFEERQTGQPTYAFLEGHYWIRKLQARFFAGDYESALDAAQRAEKWYATSAALNLYLTEMVDCCLFAALTRSARCEPIGPDPYADHQEMLGQHERKLRELAANCPDNYEGCAALVGAEIARLQGRELDAERLYEEAIRSARDNGFVHNEALANELAARFHAARGFETIARAYLRNARYGYLRWGADGKVRQLDQLYPYLGAEEAASAASGSIGALVEQLDLATVIRVSQAVSGEMVLEKLLDTVMRTALEQAGAERAVLMLSPAGGLQVAAEATTDSEGILVQLRQQPVTGALLPETIVRYVLHTHESVILDDATVLDPFSTDPYISQRRARSILCLPLSSQGTLIGALYLENNLAPRVFVPARVAVLKVLASQAAISLENARLYREVAEREGRIRRLVDANIIGIVISDVEGRILEANDAFLHMVGYDRDDLVSQRVRWTDMTPPEWRERDRQQLVPELKRTGRLQPFEKEFFRKDGSRVPVLIGVANFEDAGDEGVAFVLDLSEQKRAQEALNRASAELAHVSRVTALSALTASIAHEVNQPLAGIVTNAGTCLRMLDATPPNIDGARETARRTIRDGNRASEVITRLRALFSKAEVAPESLDLNEVVRDILALSSNDLQRNRVILRTELANDLPPITGDRIQLQQVVLNLVRNASDAMADINDRPRQVLVRTERDDSGGVRLSVRDAGVGLSPQALDSLFDPFYTTKSGGMGIGLFVSRSIVEKHEGRLWAEPNQDAPGATFALSIPIG